MKAQKSYYVSATAIVIENRNNGLRDRKLDFTRYGLRTVYHSIQILSSLLYSVIHCFRICELNDTYLQLVYATLKHGSVDVRVLFSRIIDQCNSVNLMLSLRTVITDFEKAAMNAQFQLFSQMLSVVGVVSTSGSLGGAEFSFAP